MPAVGARSIGTSPTGPTPRDSGGPSKRVRRGVSQQPAVYLKYGTCDVGSTIAEHPTRRLGHVERLTDAAHRVAVSHASDFGNGGCPDVHHLGIGTPGAGSSPEYRPDRGQRRPAL